MEKGYFDYDIESTSSGTAMQTSKTSKKIFDDLSFDYGVDCTIRSGSAPPVGSPLTGMQPMGAGYLDDPYAPQPPVRHGPGIGGKVGLDTGFESNGLFHSTSAIERDPYGDGYGMPGGGTAPVASGFSTAYLENFGMGPVDRAVDLTGGGGMKPVHNAKVGLMLNDRGDASVKPLRAPTMQDLAIDFTRPDGYRTRPLLVEGRSLYVCEHYMSIWSPVLKSFIIDCPNRELILPNIRYEHMLEVLECISPMNKEITEKNLHYILPIAAEFQMDGLLHRCELYLIENLTLPILEKLWLGDRYKLKRLVIKCMTEIRPQSKIDISGPKYYTLSDRVKVHVLERIHGAKAPEPIMEPPIDASAFTRLTEVMYASIKGKTGRAYYTNPYYLAAWSNVVAEKMATQNVGEFVCGCTQEELKFFLMAVYPPQLRITENNVAPILMAACKLEAPGVMRRCANMILNPVAQLTVFAKLSLLDRCFMHDLLDTCLKSIRSPEQALEMTQQGHYDCLSVRARAALLDRLTDLLKNPGFAPHRCYRCAHQSTCDSVNWVCPSCGSYCAATGNAQNALPPKAVGTGQQEPQYIGGQHSQSMVGPGTMGTGPMPGQTAQPYTTGPQQQQQQQQSTGGMFSGLLGGGSSNQQQQHQQQQHQQQHGPMGHGGPMGQPGQQQGMMMMPGQQQQQQPESAAARLQRGLNIFK